MGASETERGADESNERKPVTKKMQRTYDAMLIKTFRENKRMSELGNWLAPWGIDLQKHSLKRCPKNVYWPERIQEMVGRYMRPLADRLWDTDRSQDIATLDWMVKIRLGGQDRKWDNERAALKRTSNLDRSRAGHLREDYEKHLRNNQWHVTK